MLKQVFSSRPKGEKLVVFAVLFLACLTLAHAIYYSYSAYYEEIRSNHPGLSQQAYYRLENTVAVSPDHPLYSGTDHAPNQYRIGVAYSVKFIAEKLHIKKYYILFSSVDFTAAFLTCSILYLLLCDSPFFRSLKASSQTMTVMLFLISLAYPFSWVVPWQRYETLPTSMYLALMLLLLDRVRSHRAWTIAILVITVWQAFVRADVPAIFGLAICLFTSTPYAKEMFGTRKRSFLYGCSILITALAIQAYLKFIVFPHATYPPSTPVLGFVYNLEIRHLTTFAIAILPFAFTFVLASKYRKQLDSTDVLILFASNAYLPLWWTVGMTVEVRIFVPFLLASTPTIAKLMLLVLERQERSQLPVSLPGQLLVEQAS
ncbi:MAG TPA: hypothetical protein VIX42_02620 [Edaphobacter sp.]